MPKPAHAIPFAPRPRAGGATLFRWLYDEILTAILEGRLAPGSRLPSSRALARVCEVARGTVVAAFDQLALEGYLEGSVGSGTYVRQTLPDPLLRADPLRARALPKSPPSPLSGAGRRLAAQPFPKLWSAPGAPTFRLDRPALDAFPLETWSRLAMRRLRADSRAWLSQGEPLGLPALRSAIAGHLGRTRGLRCTADEVVITSGTQHSLDLAARLLLDPGDRVWIEDPGYAAVSALARAHGAEVIGVPVDGEGIECEKGWCLGGPPPRFIYTTPSCQFPLGMTLSLERRLRLLQRAGEADAWVFEDDYDGQLQFEGRPLAALRTLDRRGAVIYSNSFNKVLFTSLRLGFLVLPGRLVEPARAALSITRRFGSVLEQAVLADFIAEGHLDQHLRRMRELYTARREALVAAARDQLGGVLELAEHQGGLQIVGWLAPDIDEAEASRRAAEHGIDAVPLSRLAIGRRQPAGLVLGFAGADVPAIRRAVERLGTILRELAKPTPRRRA